MLQTASLIASEWRRRSPKGLILDLRGNPGGQFQSAIGHASIFVEENSPIASLRSNSPVAKNLRFNAHAAYYTRRGETDPLADLPAAVRALPLVVLVDKTTASGAELIAAAIRDNERGLIIGHPTSGVASIQLLSMLPNGGAIRYTSAYWDPPSAVAVQGTGVRPNIAVTGSDDAAFVAAALEGLETLRARKERN